MLIYHPAFDSYHCVYRLIYITERVRELEYAKLRILDFYLCFPAEIARIELPLSHQAIRAVARTTANKFRGPVSPLRAFRDLEEIQNAAARLLAASKVFDPEKLEGGTVRRTDWSPLELGQFQGEQSSAGRALVDLIEYIVTELSSLPLGGTGGLKQRTGLMEFRYDPT